MNCPYCETKASGTVCVTCKGTGQLPRFKRELKTMKDEDLIIIIEREGQFNGRSRKGHALYKWDDQRVALSLAELKGIWMKYEKPSGIGEAEA